MKILYYSHLPARQPLPTETETPQLAHSSYPQPLRFALNFWNFSLYYGKYLVRRS
ncbi:MAG: hypothetical protein LRZ84_15745 [Desertifilum sp.]|nr:hypothetical protein [Desertifilum sp.]MDI9635209.1 hypothetical protein [Geitlerinema splendidum]